MHAVRSLVLVSVVLLPACSDDEDNDAACEVLRQPLVIPERYGRAVDHLIGEEPTVADAIVSPWLFAREDADLLAIYVDPARSDEVDAVAGEVAAAGGQVVRVLDQEGAHGDFRLQYEDEGDLIEAVQETSLPPSVLLHSPDDGGELADRYRADPRVLEVVEVPGMALVYALHLANLVDDHIRILEDDGPESIPEDLALLDDELDDLDELLDNGGELLPADVAAAVRRTEEPVDRLHQFATDDCEIDVEQP